jgi:coenzyme F420-0:L-glutamate ligase / coenzyme F420-1:gamma-L-glutamate ligase
MRFSRPRQSPLDFLPDGCQIDRVTMSESYAPDRLMLVALTQLPMVNAGDDLASLILDGIRANRMDLLDHDVLVVAQKIVSKAEGRILALNDVEPSPDAIRTAQIVRKDPRLVEVILRESTRVVRQAPDVLIVEHRLGFVMANAGVDQSNCKPGHVVLLPENPDRSASELAHAIHEATGRRVAVIVNDSIGRPWRNGAAGHALGVAGMVPVIDLRGTKDLSERPLQVTEVAVADEIAAAASLLMGQAREGKPVVLVRGFRNIGTDMANGPPLLRDRSLDLFR